MNKGLNKAVLGIIIVSALLSGCDTPVGSIESGSPFIVYEISGGYSGIFHKLEIDESGTARLTSIYPILQNQLSRKEYLEIKSHLKNFESYKDSYPGGCIDDFNFKFTLRNNGRERIVSYDGCSIEKYPELKQLVKLSSVLDGLINQIYEERSTWQGLTFEFSTDKSTYSPMDTIAFKCIINNTVKEVVFLWDQNFINYDNTMYKSLPPGSFNVNISLLGAMDLYGGYPVSPGLTFEIK